MVSILSDKDILQLIDTFFLKSTCLICSSNITEQSTFQKINRFDDEWFNSTDTNIESFPPILKGWSNYDGKHPLPALVIETFLDLRQLSSSHTVRLKDNEENSWIVCKGGKKTEIVLERWLIELDDTSPTFKAYRVSDEEKNSVQKQLALLLSYLHTLLQLLPSHDLSLTLSKQGSTRTPTPAVDIGARILDGSKPILSKGRIGLSKLIISTYSNVVNETNISPHLEQRKITPVWTKFGLLRVSVSYRRDCQFEIRDSDDNTINKKQPETITKESMSLSPRTKEHLGISPATQTLQRRRLSTSKPIQPFKVGSVSNANSRNPSNSSMIGIPQAHRPSISSITGAPQIPTTHIESTSIESGSRFSSSFGRLRRHSSLKSNENPLLNATKKVPDTSSEELLDFVKLLDQKPQLKIKKVNSNNGQISSSLIKFQNLKPSNDLLSEDLSMSYSMEPNQISHSRRSGSHSPRPSFSPGIHNKVSPSYTFFKGSSSAVNSRRNSLDKGRQPSILPPIYGGESMSRQDFTKETSSSASSTASGGSFRDDELLSTNVKSKDIIGQNSYKYHTSLSPKSIESVMGLHTRNRFQFQQPHHFSQPTIATAPAHAIIHKPKIHSTEMLNRESNRIDELHDYETNGKPRIDEPNAQDGGRNADNTDEDDLVFFMSDMNLPNQ